MNNNEKKNVFNFLKSSDTSISGQTNNLSFKNLSDDYLSENDTNSGNENCGKTLNKKLICNDDDYFQSSSFNYFKNVDIDSGKSSFNQNEKDS